MTREAVLAGVKVGDRIAITQSGYGGPQIKTVERVTPKGIVKVRYGERYLQEFNPDGSRRGDRSGYRCWARPATPEDEAKFADQQNFDLLRRFEWEHVTPELRAAVVELIAAATGRPA